MKLKDREGEATSPLNPQEFLDAALPFGGGQGRGHGSEGPGEEEGEEKESFHAGNLANSGGRGRS